MDPAIQTGRGFHIAEVSQFEECPLDKVTNQKIDQQYESLLGSESQLTEWDVLNGNEVGPSNFVNLSGDRFTKIADMLYYLSAYNFYVRDQEREKSKQTFDLWKKPTINWDIQCEWNGLEITQLEKIINIERGSNI